jgi:exodeoxyribonuclease-3
MLPQEAKSGGTDVPFDAFTSAGYEVAHHGVDHWNGLAIPSRIGIDPTQRGFTGPQRPPFDEPHSFVPTRQQAGRSLQVFSTLRCVPQR